MGLSRMNASQEAMDAYPAELEKWKQRMCAIAGLCAAQADTPGSAAPDSDIPPGFYPEQPSKP